MMKKITVNLFLLFLCAATNAQIACKDQSGALEGDSQFIFDSMLGFAEQNSDIDIWIVFPLSFTPNEPQYAIDLQLTLDNFNQLIEGSGLSSVIYQIRTHQNAPGLYATVAVEGLNFLRDSAEVKCVSRLQWSPREADAEGEFAGGQTGNHKQ